MNAASAAEIVRFGFEPGRIIAGKYEVAAKLGAGWEGEVYLVRECTTGIERTAKFFFPARNPHDRVIRLYAKKLHRLRHCPVVIQYHTQDTAVVRGVRVTFMVSDYVEGELLSAFLKRQPGGRLRAFPALHLLHSLAAGLETVHRAGEYHGDLHTDNVIVQRYGLGFELKLLDLFHWHAPKIESIRHDVVEMIRIFYEALGGQRHYAKQPAPVKSIIRGMKRTLILRRFKSAAHLRAHLETMSWD